MPIVFTVPGIVTEDSAFMTLNVSLPIIVTVQGNYKDESLLQPLHVEYPWIPVTLVPNTMSVTSVLFVGFQLFTTPDKSYELSVLSEYLTYV